MKCLNFFCSQVGQQVPQFIEARTVPQTYEVRTTSEASGEPPIGKGVLIDHIKPKKLLV